MARKVNFLIKQGDVKKRIFKLFADKKGDLFVSFPYFSSTHFYCGVGCFPAGTIQREFNPVIEGTESRIPLKLSYHHDGQMHFKPINPLRRDLPLSFKNAQLRCTPFLNLNAQHMITVEVEGLDKFEDFIPTKPSELYVGFNVALDAHRFKFVVYGSLSAEDIKGRFKHCKFLKVKRPRPPNPLVLGLYFAPSREPADKGDGQPSLLCLAGFPEEEVSPDRDRHFLYLMAK
jgi:hypothetical protein